jgi:tRNA modification GTPase
MNAAPTLAGAERCDAIAAVSTPHGASVRGLVRVSGDDALRVVEARLVRGSLQRTRSIQFVRLRVMCAGERIDVPGVALVMPGPASFTGADTVELLLPGNAHLLAAVVDTLCDDRAAGSSAKRAGPGAFSSRAYCAGRLPIADAERIALSIAAESQSQWSAAKSLKHSPVQTAAEKAAEHVTALLALVEAGIDFSDQEDVVAIEASQLAARVREVCVALDGVVRQTTPEESLRALPLVALHGAPNAGKSSLFNALLGRSRAVESEIAGSTRDAIIEPLALPGCEILLCDLPGVEEPQHALAAQMQLLQRETVERATIALRCTPLAAAVDHAVPSVQDGMLVVWTKADQSDVASSCKRPLYGIATSAHTGEGLDELRAALSAALTQTPISSDAPMLLNRHRTAIAVAQSHLNAAVQLADESVARGARCAEPAELVATELRSALDELGIVAGHRTPDDVLGELFARFCIGK